MLGLGCIFGNKTGLVVDYEVLSKYCHKCARVSSEVREDKDKWEEFIKEHAKDCDRNHEESSGSMEQRAAVIIWQRSVERNGLRFRGAICDGDSNTIKAIKAVDPYDELIVEKRECVKHVAKRVRTNLRKVVEDKKKAKRLHSEEMG